MGHEARIPKARILHFDSTDPLSEERFAITYQGILAGGTILFRQQQKSMDVTRREARVLDKFDEISYEVIERVSRPDGSVQDVSARALLLGEHDVLLNEVEYRMVLDYFEHAGWLPQASRRAVRVHDWLMSIVQVGEDVHA